MFTVTFYDEAHGVTIESFHEFEDAANFWDDFADTPTCIGGKLVDEEEQETIWYFGEDLNFTKLSKD